MPIDIRTSIPAAALAFGCFVVVTARVLAAPGPPPRRAATAEERVDAANAIAAYEHGWTIETRQNFPEDLWSQRDDFHGREYRKALEIARERGIRIEDVLRAIDDDIHRRSATGEASPDARNARAIPCKPRPFYD